MVEYGFTFLMYASDENCARTSASNVNACPLFGINLRASFATVSASLALFSIARYDRTSPVDQFPRWNPNLRKTICLCGSCMPCGKQPGLAVVPQVLTQCSLLAGMLSHVGRPFPLANINWNKNRFIRARSMKLIACSRSPFSSQ